MFSLDAKCISINFDGVPIPRKYFLELDIAKRKKVVVQVLLNWHGTVGDSMLDVEFQERQRFPPTRRTVHELP